MCYPFEEDEWEANGRVVYINIDFVEYREAGFDKLCRVID